MAIIERFFSPGSVITACSSAATTTPRFPYGRWAGGGVLIASTGGVTQINWYAAGGAETVPVQIYSDGAAVTTAVTVGAHPIPDACFGFPWVAPVISGAASCAMTVCVKG
jgi:hypothetical protein